MKILVLFVLFLTPMVSLAQESPINRTFTALDLCELTGYYRGANNKWMMSLAHHQMKRADDSMDIRSGQCAALEKNGYDSGKRIEERRVAATGDDIALTYKAGDFSSLIRRSILDQADIIVE